MWICLSCLKKKKQNGSHFVYSAFFFFFFTPGLTTASTNAAQLILILQVSFKKQAENNCFRLRSILISNTEIFVSLPQLEKKKSQRNPYFKKNLEILGFSVLQDVLL